MKGKAMWQLSALGILLLFIHFLKYCKLGIIIIWSIRIIL